MTMNLGESEIKLYNLIQNIGVSIISLTFIFLVCEIGMRLTTKFIHPDEKALLFSSQTFQLDPNGAVRFEPNKKIRSVAVYNNKIEYDVHFNTNNFGFIDDKDYKYDKNPDKKYYALVGDSFTAGFHGGEPWVPALRKNIDQNKIEIYNLGVCGTGIDHFDRLLKSIRHQLYISHIIILAISGDIERRFWYPETDASEIRFYLENIEKSKHNKKPCTAKIINTNSTDKEILAVADKIYAEKREYAYNNGIKEILKRSELLIFLRRLIKNTILKYKNGSMRYSFSFEALRNIKKEFPSSEISFIHLPTKSEVINDEYYLNNIVKEIENIGIVYYPVLKKIDWQENMFHINDGHPNSLGYDNIKNIVLNYIFLKNN